MNGRIFVLVSLFIAGAAHVIAGAAHAETLSQRDAVARAMAANPTLAAAMIEAKQAHQSVLAEEDLYPFIFYADTNYGRQTKPSLSLAAGGIATSTSDSFNLSAGVSKAFSTGTSIALDLAGSINAQNFTASSTGIAGGKMGPGYGFSGRLTLSQSLIRGLGKTVGEASLRQARLSWSAAQLKTDRVASETLQAVLMAWWELSYNSGVVEIRKEAVELAKKSLAEVQSRIDKGTVAPVEALTFLTAMASREEELAQAIDSLTRQSLEMTRLLGEPGGADVSVDQAQAQALIPFDLKPDLTKVLELALENSYRIRELTVLADISRDQAKIAGEALRPKLDLLAWIQGEGLGNQSMVPAFEQFGKAQAGGAFVGLTFEMPLTNGRKRAQRAQAAMAVEVAEANLMAAAQQIRTDVESAFSKLDSAQQRWKLAQQTLGFAAQQVQATKRRYEIGTAIAIEVEQAEDAWRQAKLRVERAKTDLAQADIQIQHISGSLLSKYAP